MTYIAHRGTLISHSGGIIRRAKKAIVKANVPVEESVNISGSGFKRSFNSLKRGFKKDIVNPSNKVVRSANDIVIPVVNNNSVGGFYDNAVKPVRGGAILSSVNIPKLKRRTANNIVFDFN